MLGKIRRDCDAAASVAGAQKRATRVFATILSSTLVIPLGVGLLPASVASAAPAAAVSAAAVQAAVPSVTRLSGFNKTSASVRVGGQLVDTVSVSPKAARTVYVQYRRAGTKKFTTAYHAKASAQGSFTAFLMPKAAGTWQFRLVVVATTQAKAVVSPIRTVKASGRAAATKVLGFVSSPRTITAGPMLSDMIQVSPRASRLVEVQSRKFGTSTWVKLPTSGRSSTAGNFRALYKPSVGAWQYRIVVRASSTNRTGVSATRTITAKSPKDITAPGKVTNLSGSVLSDTSIKFTWTNPTAADFSGVTIVRKAAANGNNPAPTSISDGVLVTNTAKAVTTFTDSGLTIGRKYAYAAFAHDASGNYAAAATWFGETTNATPGEVTALVASSVSDTSIKLDWVNPADADFTGVAIRRLEGATAPTFTTGTEVIVPASATATSFTDTGLLAGTQYSYAVFALDEAGQPSATFEVSHWTSLPDSTPPGPVSALIASETSSTDTSIALYWSNPTDADFTGVMIRRLEGAFAPLSASEGTLVADLINEPVAYVVDHVGVLAGTQYTYAFFAHDGIPNYAVGTNVTYTTTGTAVPADTTAPGPVTALTTVVSADSIQLDWLNPTDVDFTGVTIRRALGSVAPLTVTDGTEIAVPASATATTFTDTLLTTGTVYSYAVFAHDVVPNNAAAVNVTATTTGLDETAPGPVTDLTALQASATSIKLDWANPAATDFTGVMIRRSVGAVAPLTVDDGTLVTDTVEVATSFTDVDLTDGIVYSYALFAHDGVPNNAAGVSVFVTAAPIAVLSVFSEGADPAKANVGEVVFFDASGSAGVTDKTVSAATLDFGDGTLEALTLDGGWFTNHSYDTDGVKTVTLTVTDSAGVSATTTKQITVSLASGVAPTATIAAAATGTVGEPVVFTVTTSSVTPITSWTLSEDILDVSNVIDGNIGVPAGTLSHTFDAPGSYTVSFDVNNEAGQTAHSSVVVVISPVVVAIP